MATLEILRAQRLELTFQHKFYESSHLSAPAAFKALHSERFPSYYGRDTHFDEMGRRKLEEAQVAPLTKDALTGICRAEDFKNYSTLSVDELRDHVVDGRLHKAASRALTTGGSTPETEVLLNELRAETLRKICKERALHVTSATSKTAAIDLLLRTTGGAGSGGSSSGKPAKKASSSSAVPAPAPPRAPVAAAAPAPAAAPAAPSGGNKLITTSQLAYLAHVQLSQLAPKVGVTPPPGGWPTAGGLATKNAAISALSGRVRDSHLDETMRKFIRSGEQRDGGAIAGQKRAREE